MHSTRQPSPGLYQLLHPRDQPVQQGILQWIRARHIPLLLSWKMSLPERHRAQWLPESRLSRRVRHTWVYGSLLPSFDPDRVQSSFGAADQYHFSEKQGLSTSQEDGVSRRADNATKSPVSSIQIRET